MPIAALIQGTFKREYPSSACPGLSGYPLAAIGAPELNVGALYDYLDSGKSTLLKRVRNSGDTTAFVKVSVAELVYDSDGNAREVDTEGLPLEQRGLVASPARLIVPAQGMQAVRLVYRGSAIQSAISACASSRYCPSWVMGSPWTRERPSVTAVA